MENKINNLSGKDGFLLKKFELYNWGTFDGKVETFLIDDDITVISGDNGSGKSTIVDAFVTLFVPSRMRKYNLSASEGSKKSRNELSYIKGAWSKGEAENGEGDGTIFLRGNDVGEATFSVLLGYFREEVSGKKICLATFFRTSLNGPKKFYIVSEQELFIKEDFIKILESGDISAISSLKTSLKSKKDTRVFDNFSEYIADFSELFGLRKNAIDLFNKVVSLKEIKDLNSFFRENMLEDNPEILLEFEECEKNYLSVKDIYEKIILSEDKLKVLEPFMKEKKKYISKKEEEKEIIIYKQNFENYSNIIENDLINLELEKKSKILEKNKLEKNEIENKQKIEEDEIKSIENLLENNDTIKRINKIEDLIFGLKKDFYIKEKKYQDYKNYINIFDINSEIKRLTENGNFLTNEDFLENNKIIQNKKVDLEEENNLNKENKINFEIEKKDLNNKIEEKNKELQYFKKRENLLEENFSKIRTKIANGIGIDEENLKFVCELIQVKNTEKNWVMPIEKLLHSFGLEMLVPEKYLYEVNKFVDKNNLKGKLKYNKIIENFELKNIEQNLIENNIFSKIDIKHNNQFDKWIKSNILKRFNYICLENNLSEEYAKNPFVITLSGLIKNKNSYIKDDRKFGIDKYILGWNNKEKIKLLEKEIFSLSEKLKKIELKILNINKFEINYNKFLNIYSKFEEIKIFEEINYFTIKSEISEKESEIEKLKNFAKENDKDLILNKEKLEKHKNNLNLLTKNRDSILENIGIINSEIKKINSRKNYLFNIINNLDILNIKNIFKNSDFEILEKDFEKIRDIKEEKIKKIEFKKEKIFEEIIRLLKIINKYIYNFRESKMTNSERNEFSLDLSEIEKMDYLEKEFHKIKNEQLYKYREKFERNFRDDLFKKLKNFYYTLDYEVENIKNKISDINILLKTIEYSKETFIEISLKNNTKKVDGIEDFKKEFRDKILNKREFDLTDKLKAFEDVKDFMENLIDENDKVGKNNKIDVRNWFLFTIKEKSKIDDSIKNVFENSSGQSGGQTIKFAYSVLAASLLYQYGIKDENKNLINNNFSKSFRLIVIDEVFAKLDIDNSQYVLNLFKKLGFQLFVITPSNTINVLEDYVNTIYFITNKDRNDSSKIKIDIKSSTKILEKKVRKPENIIEKKFLEKEEIKKAELEEMRLEMF